MVVVVRWFLLLPGRCQGTMHSGSKWLKTRQKLDYKTLEIIRIILVQASFWRIMDVKGMQLSETEIYVIKSASCKYVEKSWNQVNLFLAGFNNLESKCDGG